MAHVAAYRDGYRVSVKHRGVRRSATFPTAREARAWGRRIEAQIDAGMFTDSDQTPFSRLAQEYLTKVSSRKAGEVWEARRVAAFVRHFGDRPLGAIDAPQIAAWRDMRLETVTGSTVVREVNLLRAMFRVARDEWRWIRHDPFKGVKIPQENEPRRAVWRWQQIKRVLRYPGGPKTLETIAAFHISLRTSMRLQEALEAPRRFDRRRRVVTLAPDETKARRRVEIPVGRIAAKLIDRPPFVVGPQEASRLFAVVCAKLGIEGLTFHDARATALTLLSRKVDVMTLAKISQHKDIRILQNTYYRERADDIARRL